LYEAKFGDLRFIFRWKDFFMVDEVLVQNEYAYVLNLIKGGDKPLILDLGANIGTFSLYLLRNLPSARIYAYEASGDTFSILNMNKHKNFLLDWNVFQSAVWKEDGFISFETREFSGSSCISSEGRETVPSVSFATVLKQIPNDQNIDLIKIDVEGAEEAVLLHHSRDVFLRIKNLVIELHPKVCDTDAVIHLLRENFEYLYEMPGRKSSKPLLIATRRAINLPLFQQ
jgi:FkbM family methyltransferase